MKWTIITPPTSIVSNLYDAALVQSRIDSLSASPEDDWFSTFVVPQAISSAQNQSGLSLTTCVIEAIVYDENDTAVQRADVRLARGPVQSITSVIDGNEATIDPAKYELRREGLTDLLRLKIPPVYPITITYEAGFGDAFTDIPAEIVGAMLAHIAFLYDNRAGEPDPDGLDRIYRRYRSFAR